jgi:transporter family protein
MWISFILASAVLLALYDTAKKHSVRDNGVMPVLFLATAFGALAFALALAAAGRLRDALAISSAGFRLVALKSLIVAASWVFVYYAMRALPLSVAAPIRASAQLWTLAGALVLFHEIPTPLQALGMAVILAGYGLFSVAGRAEGIRFTRHAGVFCAFAGTLLGAGSALYDKYLLHDCGLERNAMQLMAADWFYFGALSQEGVAVSVLSLIRRSNVALSFAAGALVFRERNLRRKGVALAAILAGVALLCLSG